jgi:N-acetylmuramoyl-L-alanine amidase
MRSNNRRLLAITAALLLSLSLAIGYGPMTATAGIGSRQESPPSPLPGRPRAEFLVVLDASHGGDDNGATLAGKLLEKDLTLALARDVKRELEDRGVMVRMLRDSDINLSLERRAETANELRPGLYVAIHAGMPGQGARVYAPALPMAGTASPGPFLPWESAQAASIEQSKTAARIVTAEIRKTGMPVREMTTPLRPLNNLAAPAIAVEWAPGQQGWRPQQMQKQGAALASSVAAGIVQSRAQIGARP